MLRTMNAARSSAGSGALRDAVLRARADPQRRQILHLVRGGGLAARPDRHRAGWAVFLDRIAATAGG
jgi:hypothetical protein